MLDRRILALAFSTSLLLAAGCNGLGDESAELMQTDESLRKEGAGKGGRADAGTPGDTDAGAAPADGGTTSSDGGTVGPHDGLTWTGYGQCLECHAKEATDMHGSVHYQWKGQASNVVNGPAVQGKRAGSMNAYCVNITGNWAGCSTCHVGRGAEPQETVSDADLANIDCLVCHQKQYKRVRVNGLFEPDTAKMTITLDQAVQTVHLPERSNCLQCHAKGGGGDNFKRGDLALAHGTTADVNYDVHMATTGANLDCQSCHDFTNHRVAGRGSDLRVTDSTAPIGCDQCHGAQGPHAGTSIEPHLARVACQSCHIRTFARNASDTAATEATEMFRDWTAPEWIVAMNRYEPTVALLNDQKPTYRFWNKTSWVYNLGDPAVTSAAGRYVMSMPQGAINQDGSKLYPFKYKTANQPYAPGRNQLVAIDTAVYFKTGDTAAAVKSGLVNMGLPETEPTTFVTTEEYQALNHEVPPGTRALQCSECHENTAQLDLKTLGYTLKAEKTQVCSQCHRDRDAKPFADLHSRHKPYDCSWCHDFSRPERGLKMP